MPPLSELVLVNIIAVIGSIGVAIVGASATIRASKKTTEIHDEVKNKHQTNLRHDVDDQTRGITALHERITGVVELLIDMDHRNSNEFERIWNKLEEKEKTK